MAQRYGAELLAVPPLFGVASNVPTYGIIYLIRDKTNGKVYVGRTTQALAMRWAGHVHDSKREGVTGLLGAIKRSGPDAFTVEELERHPDKGSLMLAERAAIERYRARDPNVGYNIMIGNRWGGDYVDRGPLKEDKEPRTEILRIRLTKARSEALAHQALVDGRTVSDWARVQLELALDRVSKAAPLPEPTSMPTGGDATVRVAPEGSASSPGGGSSTEGDDLASLLAEMEDFSPEG